MRASHMRDGTLCGEAIVATQMAAMMTQAESSRAAASCLRGRRVGGGWAVGLWLSADGV